jgi:hypothetical protein
MITVLMVTEFGHVHAVSTMVAAGENLISIQKIITCQTPNKEPFLYMVVQSSEPLDTAPILGALKTEGNTDISISYPHHNINFWVPRSYFEYHPVPNQITTQNCFIIVSVVHIHHTLFLHYTFRPDGAVLKYSYIRTYNYLFLLHLLPPHWSVLTYWECVVRMVLLWYRVVKCIELWISKILCFFCVGDVKSGLKLRSGWCWKYISLSFFFCRHAPFVNFLFHVCQHVCFFVGFLLLLWNTNVLLVRVL